LDAEAIHREWFEIRLFPDFYLLPIARRLKDTRYLAKPTGCAFANIANRDRWMTDGFTVATNVISYKEPKRYARMVVKTDSPF
jgi:hypothetical protein